jgi:hypothetical protein
LTLLVLQRVLPEVAATVSAMCGTAASLRGAPKPPAKGVAAMVGMLPRREATGASTPSAATVSLPEERLDWASEDSELSTAA